MRIYDYTSYRAFLDAWLDEKDVRTNRGLAMRLGVSPTLVSLIRTGRRKLAVDKARHWAWALRLDAYETDYFDALVRMAHGPSEKIRGEAEREAAAVRNWEEARSREVQLQLYSEWYIAAVFEMVRLPQFQRDPAWIASQLMPPIDEEQAQHALDVLFAIGMLVETEDGIERAQHTSATSPRVDALDLARAVRRGHEAFLEHVAWTLGNVQSGKRFAAHPVFAAPEERLQDVIDTVRKLMIESAEEAEREGVPNRVYQLGIYLAPRSER